MTQRKLAELTTQPEIARHDNDKSISGDAYINRWQNYGKDRLYVENWGAKFWVDLKNNTLEFENARAFARMDVDGSTLTITKKDHDQEMVIELDPTADEDETDEDSDDSCDDDSKDEKDNNNAADEPETPFDEGDVVRNPSQRPDFEWVVVETRRKRTFNGEVPVFVVRRKDKHEKDWDADDDLIYERNWENWELVE